MVCQYNSEKEENVSKDKVGKLNVRCEKAKNGPHQTSPKERLSLNKVEKANEKSLNRFFT